jgi:Na+/proline symporter
MMTGKLMSTWAAGLIKRAFLRSAISTADSVLLLAGTTFVRDHSPEVLVQEL